MRTPFWSFIIVWFDVKTEEFGLLDPPKPKGGHWNIEHQLVDLNGELCGGFVSGCWNKEGGILLTSNGGKWLFVYCLKTGSYRRVDRGDRCEAVIRMYQSSLFSIRDAVVAFVVGSFVCTDCVCEFILRSSAISGFVGEKHGGSAHTENAIAQKHGSFVAGVPVECDVLHAQTTAYELGFAFNKCCAKSIDISPAQQPIPPRLKLMMSDRSL
ncbi:hypothetical protein L1987_33815 [Smallanthus sonchifolius]|uniref:Uncharacterized protein n=1 Tax=Smallanthus sonchifolius TaxID=185202 RepID=A0ACB9HSW7_9ASTR|nr:hypothetical protein L1987_33815 [Smallanthus sonchifolius]